MAGVVVVTGAAGAVGSEIVRHLLASGHKVGAIDRTETAARLDALGPVGAEYLALPGDASSRVSFGNALSQVEQRLGAPAGAVLVAGGWQGGKPLYEADDSVWRAMLDVNVETARAALEALLPGMVRRQAGSIVLFGSRAAVRPWDSAGAAAYAAAKAAVLALAQATAAEVLEHRVRVNVVLPSTIDTLANRRAMPGADPTRWVPARSMARVVEFLLSDAAEDISGAALPVYGRA